MSAADKTTIKNYFKKGDIPTQSNFTDLIDSYVDVIKTTPTVLVYNASLTPDIDDGLLRTTDLTGDVTLNEPADPTAGAVWEWYVTAFGAARNLSLHANIKIPSDSSFTSPKSLDSGKTYVLQLRYIGSSWCLTSLVGGF